MTALAVILAFAAGLSLGVIIAFRLIYAPRPPTPSPSRPGRRERLRE